MYSEKSAPFDVKSGFDRMRERTQQARDDEATRLFSAANLNAVLSAAASKGQSAAVFTPSIPMDLSDTSAAKAVKAMLENARFLVEWKTTRLTPDSEPYTVLRVSWGADSKRGA